MRTPRYPVHPAAEILPMLPEPERRRLARDIKKRGLIQPILLYQGQIIDGRNRQRACADAGIEPRYHVVDPELDQRGLSAVEFVISLNLRRRHLSASQQAVAAATVLPQWTREGKTIRQANLRHRARRDDGKQLRHRGRSDQEVGKLFGVSPRYVRLAANLIKTNTELAERVRCGKCTLSRAVRLQRALENQRVEREQLRQIQRHQSRLVVRHLDMRKGQQVKQRFDLIITDPPYSRDDLPLFDHLARLAGTVLVKGGYLAVMTGLQFLDQTIAALARPEHGLKYVWTVCLSFNGNHGRRSDLGFTTCWRPILLFSKLDAKKPPKMLFDRYGTTLPLVPQHEWEQLPSAFTPLVKCLSRRGDHVLDPFAGSGAVLEECRMLGRHAEGWGNDPKAIALMEERFAMRAARG